MSSRLEAGSGVEKEAAASSSPADAAPPPSRLGKYKIRKRLGAGGMGTVYLAVDTQLRRTVALKVLPREKAANETLVRRFHSEAQAAAQLKHENIVTVYEAGELDGYLFMALEYVEGTDVFKLVSRRGVIPVKRSLDIVKQVARALQHAHSRNIVHRDIKPSNLLIQRDGTVKLTDMGLARLVDETIETDITRAGTTVGTVDYIAPEQARDSRSADIRSDIYSLGCTWYQMLTGEPPFPEGSMTNKLYGHMAKERPDPRNKNKSVPQGIVQVMHRMMARRKKDRYQTPDELLSDLENVSTRPDEDPQNFSEKLMEAIIEDDADLETADGAAAERTPESVRPASRRHSAAARRSKRDRGRVVAYAAGVAVLALVVGLVWYVGTRFASVFDGPGAVVARSGDHEEPGGDAAGGGSRGGNESDNGGRSATAENAGENDGRSPVTTTPRRPVRVRAGPTESAFLGTAEPQVLESITIGREGEKQFLPAWVADAADPDSALDGDGTTVTVGRGDRAPSHFADLNGALENLPPSGGLVRLLGDGPFELRPLAIDTGGTIVITSEPGSRPVVVFEPDHKRPTNPVVRVRRGRLALLGLHLTAVAERFATREPVALFDVSQAEVAVRRCSATLLGARPGRTALFRLSGAVVQSEPESEQSEARLLLDRSFLRGRWTPLELRCHSCDLVAWNCLFATGDAPLLQTLPAVSTPEGSGQTAAEESRKRLIRLLSCTASARRAAFHFRASGEAENPPATKLLLLNSLLAASARNDDRTDLVLVQDWPHSEAPAAGRSQFPNLDWSVRSSLFLGWSNLVRQLADDPIIAGGPARWQRVWQSAPVRSEFLPIPWPNVSGDTGNPASLVPSAFDPSTTKVRTVVATDQQLPGCSVVELPLPDDNLLRRVRALAHSPVPPAGVRQGRPENNVVRVDLDNEDLGRVISAGDWSSGTLFVASGSGPRRSSPIRVRGKSLRIEFRQGEGLPLELAPRPIDLQDVADGGEHLDAFISIVDGTIELSGGNLQIPRSTSITYPRWFLYAKDAGFAIENCMISGAMLASSRNKGLIQWTITEPGRSRYAGRYSHFGQIRASYLAAYGTLLRTAARGQALSVENSVLVSIGRLFELQIEADDRGVRGAVALDRCTLSAGDRFFDVRTERSRTASAHPLRLFASRTVFAPPVNPGRTGPTLVALPDNTAITMQQLQWWGNANAYSHLIRDYLAGTQADSRNFADSFVKTWGPAACLHSIAENGDVALNRNYPTLSRLGPDDFQLDPACRAAQWDELGRAIGAGVNAVRLPVFQRKDSNDRRPNRPRNPDF